MLFKFNYKYSNVKYLSFGLISLGGRNNQGRLVRARKSSAFKFKRNYTWVGYFRQYKNLYVPIRFDFNNFRNKYLMLVYSLQYGLSYYSSIEGLKLFSPIYDNIFAESGRGSTVELGWLVSGQVVSNVGFNNSNSHFVRSSGSGAEVITNEAGKVSCKLPSGTIKIFLSTDKAVLGRNQLNTYFKSQNKYKAGFWRTSGWKSAVRGVAKNPVDHPHGGGEGKKSPHAIHRSPWGWITLDLHKYINSFKNK